ncbi:hypothetical protein SPPR111872_18670 [Sphingobacterium prati]
MSKKCYLDIDALEGVEAMGQYFLDLVIIVAGT